MTMHAQLTMSSFANSMVELWRKWDGANYPGVVGAGRRDRRRRFVESAIRAATTFMPTPNIVHADLGSGVCGSFSWPSWKLSLNRSYTADTDIEYGDFLEFCVTIYHETRHCEQFFRVAQGLAGGKLAFPDQTTSSIINHHRTTQGLGTVQERMQMFQQASSNQSVRATPQMIASWLNIPLNVANQASANANNLFTAFEGTIRPGWFKRNTIRLEVEEWMRECYKSTLSGVGNWAQGSDAPYKFYTNQPTERDAHGIEDGVKALIETGIGVTEDNGASLTRKDNAFSHL